VRGWEAMETRSSADFACGRNNEVGGLQRKRRWKEKRTGLKTRHYGKR
jgi:hypothetical protein